MIAALIIGWLTVHGYGAPQREALLEHARVESGWLPSIVSRHGDVGLYQWRGPRKRALLAYERRRVPEIMTATNASPLLWSDRHDRARLTAQLEFMDHEWRQMPAASAFFAAKTRAEAYRLFCRHFERRACR